MSDSPSVRPFQALIFDCDGTLTDSMETHYRSWRRALELRGLTLNQDDFYSRSGTPSSRVIPEIAHREGVEIDFSAALRDKERFFLAEIKSLKRVDSVAVVASICLGQIPMAVASGGTRALVVAQLEQVEMLDWFDAIVTCEDTERHKPDPDVFLEAARRLQVAAEDCCVFEDGEPGIEAAEKAGMKCIDVRPYSDGEGIEQATEEMLSLIASR